MNDFRRAKRRKVNTTIELRDAMLEQVIGRIGNLSESGMLAQTQRALNHDALYQLRFLLTDRNGERREIELGAHQLWTDAGAGTGQFWCGLRFIDINADDLRFLRDWVEEPGAQHV